VFVLLEEFLLTNKKEFIDKIYIRDCMKILTPLSPFQSARLTCSQDAIPIVDIRSGLYTPKLSLSQIPPVLTGLGEQNSLKQDRKDGRQKAY
jgi:hypothetical protein